MSVLDAADGEARSSSGEPGGEVAKLAPVGAQGVGGGSPLVGQDAEVGVDQAVFSWSMEDDSAGSIPRPPPAARRATRRGPTGELGRALRGVSTASSCSAAACRARMMHAMDGFETAEGQVGVDLRGGDVGVAEHDLHAAQVGAVLDHVRGATVAQAVRAGGVVRCVLTRLQIHWRVRGMPRRERKRRLSELYGLFLRTG